jgi:hypothetical protein
VVSAMGIILGNNHVIYLNRFSIHKLKFLFGFFGSIVSWIASFFISSGNLILVGLLRVELVVFFPTHLGQIFCASFIL